MDKKIVNIEFQNTEFKESLHGVLVFLLLALAYFVNEDDESSTESQ